MTNKPMELEEVLTTILVEEEEPSYEAMNRWIEQYPQYRTEIAHRFATWAIQSEREDSGESVDSTALANRGVSHALSLLEARERASTLIERARVAQVDFEQLAERTELDDSILLKLNRHLITNVPRLWVKGLALALNESLERMGELVIGTAITQGLQHKAAKKPVTTQQDFKAALKASSLPLEAQQRWLERIEADEAR